FLQMLLGTESAPSPLNRNSFPPGLALLVVEDNEVNRKVLGRQLSSLELTQIDFARDGREALELFKPDRHQVVLMDIQMPVMDGVETMAFIRDTYPELKTPFVAVTAHALPGDRESYMETGFQGYLSKPVGLEALRQVLGEVLALE
ncbi:MAG: response regulator, partial [Rhodocyclaceae bacterium]|nr:response regulator [Rhodocyclaceae bacterium]